MFERINRDLINAMKSGDKFELSVLRMIKSALKNEEINKKGELTDDEVLAILKKQVKVRRDSKGEYEKYERMDLVDALGKEIDLLSKYLPEELSEDELKKAIDEIINEIDSPSIKSMGVIIKTIGEKYGASVDMQLVSSLVKEKLSNL